ncbi:hypothetical protein ACFQO1_01590 [Jejudonia soesokkakensis]|uniref:Uncharacterized protein n=1 Tax=Jejudonia soesokkakensis TaxID=1323432 RepID=A0ABW2MRA2_9FLAO
MTTETNSNKFKILIGVLSALLIALAVYTFTLYNDSKDTVSTLETEKQSIEAELEDLIANYDEIIQENELKDKDLLAARERIEVLLDSVKDAEANVDLIRRYKIEVGKLKTERKMLFARADSLITANRRLAMQRDSTNTVLNNTIKVVDSVNLQNEEMSQTLKEAAVVGVVDLRGEAVIVRSSGKVVDTRRSSRADKIRACFTLTPNKVAKVGDRTLFAQITNPKGKIVGKGETFNYDGGSLTYSQGSVVFYEKEELDVCILSDVNEADLIEGNYSISIFDGPTLVATTTMELK